MKEFKDIKHFIRSLKQLPSLSPVALRIMEITDEEDSSIQEITKLIESDQALSSKVLQISNYTLVKWERQGKAKTVKHATAVLGTNMIRSIALSLTVVNLFETSSDDAFSIVEFWRHNAACAIASELFAKRFSYPQPEEAFIAGLLHDLGKLILYQWKKTEYRNIVIKSNATKVRLLELEEKELEMGHTHSAKLLMELWKFPQSLINVAWLHHQPLSEFGSKPRQELPFIVKCANSLCHIQRFGHSGSPVGDMDSDQLSLVTGLSSDDLAALSTDVLNLFEEVAKNYNWKGSTPDLYLSAVSRANQDLFHQRIELRETKKQLMMQQHLNTLIYDLHESLSIPMPVGQALEKVAGMLGEVIPYKRLMASVLIEDDEIIQGWFKLNTKDVGEQITLPLNTDLITGRLDRIRLREQVSLIEDIVRKLGGELNAGPEILKALRSADLKVLPMFIGGKTIGFIMIELAPFDWSMHEKTVFMRKYAAAAATELERLILIEKLGQQSEEHAKLARKVDTQQSQIHELERNLENSVTSC
ncbi:MAG: HDOD domain-containing protein [Candidatus Anammoxibacter sp.]